MTPHLPCAAVDRTWRQGGSRRINCQANQCQSGLRVWIPPSLVKSIYSRVRTEPDNSARHVRRLCSSNIFLKYRVHSRRAPPKPVISLVSYLISSVLQLSRKNSGEESEALWSCKRTQFAEQMNENKRNFVSFVKNAEVDCFGKLPKLWHYYFLTRWKTAPSGSTVALSPFTVTYII